MPHTPTETHSTEGQSTGPIGGSHSADETERPRDLVYSVSKASRGGKHWARNGGLRDAFGEWDDLPHRYGRLIEVNELGSICRSESCVAACPETRTMIVSLTRSDLLEDTDGLEVQFLWTDRQSMSTTRSVELEDDSVVSKLLASVIHDFDDDGDKTVWVLPISEGPLPSASPSSSSSLEEGQVMESSTADRRLGTRGGDSAQEATKHERSMFYEHMIGAMRRVDTTQLSKDVATIKCPRLGRDYEWENSSVGSE